MGERADGQDVLSLGLQQTDKAISLGSRFEMGHINRVVGSKWVVSPCKRHAEMEDVSKIRIR
jgi:hypothetical protein